MPLEGFELETRCGPQRNGHKLRESGSQSGVGSITGAKTGLTTRWGLQTTAVGPHALPSPEGALGHLSAALIPRPECICHHPHHRGGPLAHTVRCSARHLSLDASIWLQKGPPAQTGGPEGCSPHSVLAPAGLPGGPAASNSPFYPNTLAPLRGSVGLRDPPVSHTHHGKWKRQILSVWWGNGFPERPRVLSHSRFGFGITEARARGPSPGAFRWPPRPLPFPLPLPCQTCTVGDQPVDIVVSGPLVVNVRGSPRAFVCVDYLSVFAILDVKTKKILSIY